MPIITENERIATIIKAGSRTAMNLEEIIKLEISEWKASEELGWMYVGQRYYANNPDILRRKRLVIGEGGQLVEDKNLANNKLVHNFLKKLVKQKVGYLLSKPLSIQTDNTAYQELLQKYFNKAFLQALKNLGKEAIIKGKAWLHIYYNDQGLLSLKRIPAEEIIPLWRDTEHTMLDALIRIYEVETYLGITKTIVTKVEFWDTSGVKRYILSDDQLTPDFEQGEWDSHFRLLVNKAEGGKPGEKLYNWERIPFICFKYNDDEVPLIKDVKSLVDDYDKRKSSNSNDLDDLPNSIYVIKDYDGTDLGEFRHNLSVYRAVKVTEDGGLETKSLEINTEAYKNHMEMDRKDIYEFGRGVDTQSDKFGNSPSGIALKFLYSDLDMDANDFEAEFQAGLEQLRWFIDQHIANTARQDFSEETVDFILNRDILMNETDTITNAKNSVGIISDETVISNHPWVTDAKDELKRVKEEREESLSDYPGLGGENNVGKDDGSED
ncbi:phage portal protein [Desulfosporosinus youngiae]|uniref:Phage portal protein, SPP1 family n=1 Tax=Desulfosporosinus youngiae DSM 17734 TaxID=768710 RepID=H5XZV9_9FIRM|nr:phage portal protein [Desulfosporosinus youngiae]EHQ92155.1 phage portal protein, SPP1 family [Desulfosporosinus youngiae DSM 17734]